MQKLAWDFLFDADQCQCDQETRALRALVTVEYAVIAQKGR